jgi:hypothetical protein
VEPFNNSIAANIAATANSYVGQGNDSNDTHRYPIADEAFEWLGMPVGEEECAAFACYMAHKANIQWNADNPDNPVQGPVTASSGALVEWGNDTGNTVLYADVRQGDFIVIKGDSDTGYIHTAIVYHNFGSQTLNTVEADHTPGVIANERTSPDWDNVASFVRPYRSVNP